MLRAIPYFLGTWQVQAEVVFGLAADARSIMGPERDRYRVKATVRARQHVAGTLQGPALVR